MIYIVGLATSYFVEALSSYILFSHVGEKRFKSVYCFLIGTGLHSLGMFINLLGKNKIWINLIAFLIITVIFGMLAFKINFNIVCLYSVFIVAICTFFEMYMEMLITSVTDMQMQSYLTSDMVMIALVIFGKGFYLISILLMSRLIKRENRVKLPLVMFLYPISAFLSFAVIWYVCRYCNVNSYGKLVLSTVMMLLFAVVVFLLFSYQKGIERESKLLELKTQIEKSETEKTYYSIIEKQNDNLISYADETQKHLKAIKMLNSDPQIDEYINKMLASLDEYGK